MLFKKRNHPVNSLHCILRFIAATLVRLPLIWRRGWCLATHRPYLIKIILPEFLLLKTLTRDKGIKYWGNLNHFLDISISE